MKNSNKKIIIIIFSIFLTDFLIASENKSQKLSEYSIEKNYSNGLKKHLIKDYSASVYFFEKVYSKDPSYKKVQKVYADSLEKLGEKAFLNGEYKKAENIYFQLVQNFPNKIRILKYDIILVKSDIDLFNSRRFDIDSYLLYNVNDQEMNELLNSVSAKERKYYKEIASKGKLEKKLVYNYLEESDSRSGLSVFQSIMLLILFFVLLYISIYLFSLLMKLKFIVKSKEMARENRNSLPHFHTFDFIKRKRTSRFEKFLTMKKAYRIAKAIDRFSGVYRQNIETGNLVYRIVERADFLNSINPIAAQKAGYIHNIGLIRVSKLMRKGGKKLGDATIEQYRKHIEHGNEMLKKHKLPKLYFNAIYYHHERYDGSGYPEGLRGKQIPVIARIISAAVYFTGLICDSDRKHALSEATAIMMLENFSGKHFDPDIVALIKEIYLHDQKKIEE